MAHGLAARIEPNASPTRFDVAGVKVDHVEMNGACGWFADRIAGGERSVMVFCTASTVVHAADDCRLSAALDAASLVVPDGMPIVWAGRRSDRGTGRVYGPEFMLNVMARYPDIRHFFYGGAPGVADELVARLSETFPGLRIAGALTPGEIESGTVCGDDVAAINEARPDVVWVGLGHPKQKLWMSDHRASLEAPVLAGVGAAFDFLSGRKKEAPRWMKDAGLQWLHRLASEPRRLGKRYLVGNARFVSLLAAEALRHKRAA